MVWYKQRHSRKPGHKTRHFAITLDPKDWVLLESEAAQGSNTIGYWLSELLTEWCRRRADELSAKRAASSVKAQALFDKGLQQLER